MLLAIHTSTRANIFIAKLVHEILASLGLHTFFVVFFLSFPHWIFHSVGLFSWGPYISGATEEVCPQNLPGFLGNMNPEFHGTVKAAGHTPSTPRPNQRTPRPNEVTGRVPWASLG